MSVSWLSLVIELGEDDWDAGLDFWSAVTGHPAYRLGFDFALGPVGATPHLLLRPRAIRNPRIALDLHGTPPRGLDALLERGAQRCADPRRLCSPSGFEFTLRADIGGPVPTTPTRWPSGHSSVVDQLTVDVNPRCWDVERDFWLDLTGWSLSDRPGSPFSRVETPPEFPVRILLQRKEHGWTSAHLDIATDDRDREVARLRDAGAKRVSDGSRWTVLQPPVGPLICVTDRSPLTGLVA